MRNAVAGGMSMNKIAILILLEFLSPGNALGLESKSRSIRYIPFNERI